MPLTMGDQGGLSKDQSNGIVKRRSRFTHARVWIKNFSDFYGNVRGSCQLFPRPELRYRSSVQDI